MKDFDEDGWGDDAAMTPVDAGTDCNDADNTIFPGAPDTIGDGIDQNCNGVDGLNRPRDRILQKARRVTQPRRQRGGKHKKY